MERLWLDTIARFGESAQVYLQGSRLVSLEDGVATIETDAAEWLSTRFGPALQVALNARLSLVLPDGPPVARRRRRRAA